MSLKVFAIFVSSLIAVATLVVTLTGVGFSRMLDTGKETLRAVNDVRTKTTMLEIRQEIILEHIKENGTGTNPE